MRFSAVQEEDGYGVGLGQENLASDADQNMMSAVGELLPDGKTMADESSMSYSLPLLFANGYPTSLDQMTLIELERFIAFMVECSSDPLSTEAGNPPQWWPPEIKYSHPFVRPKKVNDNWLGNLKKLVFRCYTYHRSEYLLHFCASLAQYPKERLYYVNNWDSTTSLYHKSTGKLLTTFRNENMDYDKIIDNPRRPLLLHNHGLSKSSSKSNKSKEQKQRKEEDSPVVVIQPTLGEIYLCDNCDAEFGDLDQMKDHEKICGEPVQKIISRPETPYEPIIEPELNQNQFLNYFKLSTFGDANITIPKCTNLPSPTIQCEPVRSTRRVRTAVNLTRCPTIPLSSPAGIIMLKKSKTMTESIQQERLERIERHLHAPALSKSTKPKWLERYVEYNRWMVSYKASREKLGDYVHKYTFGAVKRKPALNIKSQILYVACGTCFVKLERLTPEKLEDLKKHPWKYKQPIPRKLPARPKPGPLSKSNPAHLALKRKYSLDLKATGSSQAKRLANGNHQVLPVLPVLPAVLKSSAIEFVHKPSVQPIKTVVLVDLCSSDEEDNANNHVQCDENRDPMSVSMTARPNFFKHMSVNSENYRSRSLGYQSTVSDWLRQGTLTKDSQRYSSPVKSKPITAVLKPAP